MARPELGTKRQCQSCGAKFYDLSRDPIVCPKCGTVFQVTALATPAISRVRPETARPADAGEEVIDDEAADVELVSLEEADEDGQQKSTAVDEDIDIDDDVVADDDDTFLEEEEDSDDDVSDLIDGDIEDDEEA